MKYFLTYRSEARPECACFAFAILVDPVMSQICIERGPPFDARALIIRPEGRPNLRIAFKLVQESLERILRDDNIGVYEYKYVAGGPVGSCISPLGWTNRRAGIGDDSHIQRQ